MSLTSLYQNISDKHSNIKVEQDLPPILKTDVNQYANILAKKTYLNNNQSKKIIKENATAPQQPMQNKPVSAATPNINGILQNIQSKYNSATIQEKSIILKVLSSLM